MRRKVTFALDVGSASAAAGEGRPRASSNMPMRTEKAIPSLKWFMKVVAEPVGSDHEEYLKPLTFPLVYAPVSYLDPV